jgi:hypothetical protein
MEYKAILEDPATDKQGKPSAIGKQKKEKAIKDYWSQHVLGIIPVDEKTKEQLQLEWIDKFKELDEAKKKEHN